jgi:hypothetical protein
MPTGTQWPPPVSRGEEALFGELAPAMRRLSEMLAGVEDAQSYVAELMERSRAADDALAGAGSKGHPRDERGRGPHTAWLVTVFERVNDEHRAVRALYQELAGEALERWTERQRGSTSAAK